MRHFFLIEVSILKEDENITDKTPADGGTIMSPEISEIPQARCLQSIPRN